MWHRQLHFIWSSFVRRLSSFLPQSSFPRQPSFPRRRESRKLLLIKNDKQSLRKDCMSCSGQPSVASAAWVRPWVGAFTDTQSFLNAKLLFLCQSSFPPQSSFLRRLSSFPRQPSFPPQSSFPRRRESRKANFGAKRLREWFGWHCQLINFGAVY